MKNSGGTIGLHLAGNLQHFIGALLGGTGYVRNRDAEFRRRDVPRAEMIAGLDQALVVVRETLPRLDGKALDQDFPHDFDGQRLATRVFLTHLLTHLAYHLGQLGYHRRFVTGETGDATALSIGALR